MRTFGWCAVWVGVLAAGVAHADEEKVDVTVDMVLASNLGTLIEPPSLAAMKDEFAKQNLVFKSFRLLKSEKVTVVKSKPTELRLPTGRPANLRLGELKDGKATLAVQHGKVDSKIQLGKEGKVFFHAGKHQDGQLILVFQPASALKPRRSPPLPHTLLPYRAPLPPLPERTPPAPRH